jgi:hypothetical protein
LHALSDDLLLDAVTTRAKYIELTRESRQGGQFDGRKMGAPE